VNVRLGLSASLRDPESLNTLSRIGQAVGDGWHEWLEPDPDDPRLAHYFDNHPVHREFMLKSFTRALLYPLESRRTIAIVEDEDAGSPSPTLGTDTTLALGPASIVLTAPLPVLVENEITDGGFLLRLLAVVDEPLVSRFTEPRPPLRFEHAGGKAEACKLVAHRAHQATHAGVPLRLLVLADSDSRWPGHSDHDTHTLTNACEAAGAMLHVLQKRSIENYLSDRVLRDYAAACPDVVASVEFLTSLPPVARDHYPIKHGPKMADGQPLFLSHQEAALYEGLTFPTAYSPKLPGLSRHVLSSQATLTIDDTQDRACTIEATALARWIREEL
jgi:hypothetical protein